MRIGIIGAGGVGGLTAGFLARAGHDVALVARGEALEAIRARGLQIDSELGVFTSRVDAAASPAELAPVDAVLVAVKTWQLPDVVAQIAPMLGPATYVVPLENGVDAADQCVDALGPDRVVGGLCRMLSWIAAPGTIKHVGGAPRFTFGKWQSPIDGKIDLLVRALEEAGLEVDVAADFPAALWEKFLFIASFGGVGALTRSTAGELRAIPQTRRLLTLACEEIRAIALSKRIGITDDIVLRTMHYIDTLPETATASLQRDVVAGRPSEIDALSGAVARIGAELGAPVPTHSAIYGALLPLERAARRRR